MGFVYCVTNLANGKRYVGITTRTIEQRWKEHCNYKINKKSVLRNAIRKYGSDSFAVEHLECCDNDVLLAREKLWIRILNSFVSDGRGYNLTRGGDGTVGYRFSDSQCEHMSKIRKGSRNPMFGRSIPCSEEKKKNIFRGQQLSKAFLECHNSIWKEKISLAQSRGVVIEHIDSNQIVGEWPNCRLAAEALGCSTSNIKKAIRNQTPIGKKLPKLNGQKHRVKWKI